MSGEFFELLLFAMIAAFVIFRLRSVLGKRTGHERPPAESISPQDAENNADNVVTMDRQPRKEHVPVPDDTPLAAGLAQIGLADGKFDLDEFLAGAHGAFELIIEAFATGNLSSAKSFLSPEVHGNFTDAIEAREKAGETLDTTLVGIKSCEALEARVDGKVSILTVKFVSEQVNVTRNKAGKIIDGHPDNATDVVDIWTFSRTARSRNPNWTLVETRSPN